MKLLIVLLSLTLISATSITHKPATTQPVAQATNKPKAAITQQPVVAVSTMPLIASKSITSHPSVPIVAETASKTPAPNPASCPAKPVVVNVVIPYANYTASLPGPPTLEISTPPTVPPTSTKSFVQSHSMTTQLTRSSDLPFNNKQSPMIRLSTKGSQIVDANGNHVRLRCTAWNGALEPMIPGNIIL